MLTNFYKWHIFLTLLLLINSQSLLHAESYDPSASVFRFQQKMALRGNPESQFKLGLMYETGSGVQQGLINAILWYKKAADQQYKPAQNRLIYLEIKKSGFNKSHQKWLNELKNDAKFNEGEALFLLGQMYSEGTGVNKSLTRALKLLRKAAGGNVPGSETEIKRVEDELGKLQGQYLSKKEKKKIAPIAILPAKKAIHKKPAPLKKPGARVTTKKTPVKSFTTKKPKSNSNQSQLKSPSIKTQTPTVKEPVTVRHTTKPTSLPAVKEIQEEHPMDSICGGRNRFSTGCR